jgi:hypothetical protein
VDIGLKGVAGATLVKWVEYDYQENIKGQVVVNVGRRNLFGYFFIHSSGDRARSFV